MSNLIQTSINLPENLYQDMKLFAASQKISLNQLIRDSVSEKLGQKNKKDILKLAGSLSLGNKKAPSRSQIYSAYVKTKMGR